MFFFAPNCQEFQYIDFQKGDEKKSFAHLRVDEIKNTWAALACHEKKCGTFLLSVRMVYQQRKDKTITHVCHTMLLLLSAITYGNFSHLCKNLFPPLC